MKWLPLVALLSQSQLLPAQIVLTAHVDERAFSLARSTFPRTAPPDRQLLNALQWDELQPGLESTEFTVAAGRLGLDVRIILARIDVARFDFRLVQHTRANRMTGAWNVDLAPAQAALALNAGQFKETGPWGWLVLDGIERRDPGYGPLSAGIVFDTAGQVRWIPFRELARARSDRAVRFAFQSYPTLLFNARVPTLAANKQLVDQLHRDARLILAQDSADRLLVLMTRYDALGGVVKRVPIGLTVPESIVLIGALGARHAVMLDGGVSAQMLMRNRLGEARVWKGMRDVPLALLAMPRSH